MPIIFIIFPYRGENIYARGNKCQDNALRSNTDVGRKQNINYNTLAMLQTLWKSHKPEKKREKNQKTLQKDVARN